MAQLQDVALDDARRNAQVDGTDATVSSFDDPSHTGQHFGMVDPSTDSEEQRLTMAYQLLMEADRVRRVAALTAQYIEDDARADVTLLNPDAASGQPGAMDNGIATTTNAVPLDVIEDINKTAKDEAQQVRNEGETEAEKLEDAARQHLRGMSLDHCRSVSSQLSPKASPMAGEDTDAEEEDTKQRAAERWNRVRKNVIIPKHAHVKALLEIQGPGVGRPGEPRAVQGNPFLPRYRSPLVPQGGDDEVAKRNKVAAMSAGGAGNADQQPLSQQQPSLGADEQRQRVDMHP